MELLTMLDTSADSKLSDSIVAFVWEYFKPEND
jgi:hypothetical protein